VRQTAAPSKTTLDEGMFLLGLKPRPGGAHYDHPGPDSVCDLLEDSKPVWGRCPIAVDDGRIGSRAGIDATMLDICHLNRADVTATRQTPLPRTDL